MYPHYSITDAEFIIYQSLRDPQMLMEVDATNHKTTQCYLTSSVIKHKNGSIYPSDETLQAINILVAYEYKQRVELSIICYTYIVLIQYFKSFTSVFKALVYTKTISNDAHIMPGLHTSLTQLHNYKLTEFSLTFISFFHSIFN